MTAEEKTEWLDACAAMLAPELPPAPAFIPLGVVGSYITLGGNTNTQGSRDGADGLPICKRCEKEAE